MGTEAYAVKRIELAARPMVLAGTYGVRDLGEHASTMEWWRYPDQCAGFIEWDVPTLDEVEHIGVWWDERADGRKVVTDYDGVMSIPKEAVAFLRDLGFDVTEIADGDRGL